MSTNNAFSFNDRFEICEQLNLHQLYISIMLAEPQPNFIPTCIGMNTEFTVHELRFYI